VAEGNAGFHHNAVRAARLLQQKKHRLERRCFLIEGPLLLQAAIESGAKVEEVFVLEDEALKSEAGAKQLASLHTMRVDRRTLDSLSQTKTPQGIVAVVNFIDHKLSELHGLVPKEGAASVLVLPNLSDPGNAGTLVRSAEAFGASAVCFGPDAVEPYNDKVVRASMGSLFRVPILRYDEWATFLTTARGLGLQIVAADASGVDVRVVTLPQRACLVVGQERHGLSGIPQADVDTLVALPQRAGIDSLNAGVAGSLLLYEFARTHGLFGSSNDGTTRA
jgi:TrmH family RNA methyltransferase